ncbi:MAG: hypothetical protein SFU25_04835 [Candidatus Caenarcaniphilales bacterium]|nr:hypothetical protein [Candidatus Caenarcaniphilales bacterium]
MTKTNKLPLISLIAAIFTSTLISSFSTPSEAYTTINRRQAIQRSSIRRGLRTGRISPREYTRLKRHERGIRSYERVARRSGGRLSAAERRVLHRKLDRQSRRITTSKRYY